MGTTQAAWRDGVRGDEVAQAWVLLINALVMTRAPRYVRDEVGGDLSNLSLMAADAREVSRWVGIEIARAGNSIERVELLIAAHRAAMRFVEVAT